MRQYNLPTFDSFAGFRGTDSTFADICSYTAPGDTLLFTYKLADGVSPDVVKLQSVRLSDMSFDSINYLKRTN